jgi:hypothetical protein
MANLPLELLAPVVHLDLRISPRIFVRIQNGTFEIITSLGEDDSFKNLKRRISWHCPFKLWSFRHEEEKAEDISEEEKEEEEDDT